MNIPFVCPKCNELTKVNEYNDRYESHINWKCDHYTFAICTNINPLDKYSYSIVLVSLKKLNCQLSYYPAHSKNDNVFIDFYNGSGVISYNDSLKVHKSYVENIIFNYDELQDKLKSLLNFQ